MYNTVLIISPLAGLSSNNSEAQNENFMHLCVNLQPLHLIVIKCDHRPQINIDRRQKKVVWILKDYFKESMAL